MRKIVLVIAAIGGVFASPAHAESMCQVELCNKLERFSLSPTNWVKDWAGKTCFNSVLPRSQAVSGSVVSSSSKWYQGSFNPTKKSVTRVNKVYHCD